MDKEKLDLYKAKFSSQEIGDADEFEKYAIQYRNEFVELKYDQIQPNFDKYFKLSLAVASHYRPFVQMNGCDCLFVVCDQAAPAQIKRVAPELKKCYNQLIQVGNSEVIPALLPCIERSISLVYDDPSSPDFHEFFMHYLETWSRESTTAVASFSFSKNFNKLMPFLGLSASRYLRPAISVISKRISITNSKSHAVEFVRAIRSLCEQVWPVVRVHEEEIRKIIAKAKDIGNEDNIIKDEGEKIEKILQESPQPPNL